MLGESHCRHNNLNMREKCSPRTDGNDQWLFDLLRPGMARSLTIQDLGCKDRFMVGVRIMIVVPILDI